MVWAPFLVTPKTVFRLRRRGSNACGPFLEFRIFWTFFVPSASTLPREPFFRTFDAFHRFGCDFGTPGDPKAGGDLRRVLSFFRFWTLCGRLRTPSGPELGEMEAKVSKMMPKALQSGFWHRSWHPLGMHRPWETSTTSVA